MALKTTEGWERMFLKFDAGVVGIASAVTTASLVFTVAVPIQLIAGGTILVFGTMALVDANRIRRLRRDRAKEQAAEKNTLQGEEATALKRP